MAGFHSTLPVNGTHCVKAIAGGEKKVQVPEVAVSQTRPVALFHITVNLFVSSPCLSFYNSKPVCLANAYLLK